MKKKRFYKTCTYQFKYPNNTRRWCSTCDEFNNNECIWQIRSQPCYFCKRPEKYCVCGVFSAIDDFKDKLKNKLVKELKERT